MVVGVRKERVDGDKRQEMKREEGECMFVCVSVCVCEFICVCKCRVKEREGMELDRGVGGFFE